MTKKELKDILDNEGGERANLSLVDLSEVDLSEANLSECDLRWSVLRRANLRGADLRGSDFRGANLDFSCLPLWCGSIGMTIDSRLSRQFVYHGICNMPEEDRAEFLRDPVAYANGFHRVGEVPELDWGENDE